MQISFKFNLALEQTFLTKCKLKQQFEIEIKVEIKTTNQIATNKVSDKLVYFAYKTNSKLEKEIN